MIRAKQMMPNTKWPTFIVAVLSAVLAAGNANARSAGDDFAMILKDHWFYAAQSRAGCAGRNRAEEVACAIRKQFTFEYSLAGKCSLEIIGGLPLPADVKRTWDGKVTGRYIIGTKVVIPLDGLDPALIQKAIDGDRFSLYFELTKASMPFAQVKYSDAAEDGWVTIPSPPTLSDVPADISDPEQRFQEFRRRLMTWDQVNREVYGVGGGVSFPYMTVSRFFEDNLTNSADGMQLLRANRERIFLKFATIGLSQTTAGVQGFVETVKAVLRECRQ